MGKNPYLDQHHRIQKEISMANAPVACKVLSFAKGVYVVETFDGVVWCSVKNQTRTKWSADQWVAVEDIGGDKMITGLSAVRGGV